MNILRVIVNELPESCDYCPFQKMGWCSYTGTFVYPLVNNRSDDCPLALENDNKKIANEVM